MDEIWNWPGETAACIVVGALAVVMFVLWWGWIDARVGGR